MESLNIENIDNKIVEISKHFEKAIKESSRKSTEYSKTIPQISGAFVDAVKQYHEIKTHIDPNVFPGHLFMEKAPNQSEQEFDYTKRNYKPITIPVMTDFFNALNRVMARNLYSYDSNDNEDLTEYLFNDLPIYGNIEKFFKDICLNWQQTDPNAVMTIKPFQIPMRENSDGEMIVDQSVEIEPTVYLYHVDQRPLFKKGEFCLVLLNERSLVKVAGQEKHDGFVYEFYDKNSIYRITQVGEKIDYTFEITLYWQHNLDKLPATVLGKIPAQTDNEIYYYSPIYPSVNPLDLALLDSSTLQIAKNKSAFPHMWVVRDVCEDDDCENGMIPHPSLNGQMMACPKCNSNAGPLVEYRMKPMMDPTATEGNIPTPPLGFVAPGTEILDFLRKEIEFHIEQARQQLKVGASQSNVKGSETALGKMIDREETFTFIKGISDHNFDLYRWAINMIGMMKQGERFISPTITEPDTFEIKTSNDLANEYNESVSAGMPSLINDMLLNQYVDKKFSDDPVNAKKLDIQVKIDRLISMAPDTITKGIAQRNISNIEKVVHDSFNTFLENAINSDSEFLNRDLEVQRTTIFGLAQQSLDLIQQTTQQTTPNETQPPSIE